jgi:hypothetical protein
MNRSRAELWSLDIPHQKPASSKYPVGKLELVSFFFIVPQCLDATSMV